MILTLFISYFYGRLGFRKKDRPDIKHKPNLCTMKRILSFIICCLGLCFVCQAQPAVTSHQTKQFTKPELVKPLLSRSNIAAIIADKELLVQLLTEKAKSFNSGLLDEAKQKLDSMVIDGWLDDEVWGKGMKYEYAFDEYGRQTRETTYSIMPMRFDEWIPFYEYQYLYNDQGLLGELKLLLYLENQWNLLSTQLMEYDAAGNVVVRTTRNLDPDTQQWTNVRKEESEYNAMNQLIVFERFDWSVDTWIPDRKYLYEYTVSGLIRQLEVQYWEIEQETYAPYSREEYDYNDDNKVIEIINYYWAEAKGWDPYSKTVYEYFGDEYSRESISYYWENGVWNPSWRALFEFNPEELTGRSTDFSWNNGSWRNQERTDYWYDEFFNLLVYLDYYWNEDLVRWDEAKMNEFSYDTNFSKEDLLLPAFNEGEEWFFQYMLLDMTEFVWDSELSDWKVDMKLNLYWTETIIIGKPERSLTEFNIFPNPVTDMLFVSTSSNGSLCLFELYDAQGKLRHSEVFTDELRSDLTGLSQGVYFCRAQIGNKYRTKKIIKW